MSSYYTPRKVVIGRYWKRPKPRIYECNLRDAERFYQESYKDYLQNKEFAARRASEERESRYGIQRSNSSTVQSRAESGTREATDNSSRYNVDDSQRGMSSYRASSVSNVGSRDSPEGELASIEQRLQRLRKLRGDLGIDTSNDVSSYKSSSSTSSRISARQTSPIETRTTETSYSSNRSDGRSRGGDSETYLDKYGIKDTDSFRDKYGSDKNKSFSSSYTTSSSTEDSYKPSNKSVSFSNKEDFVSSRRRNKYDDDSDSAYGGLDSSSSYKSSSNSKTLSSGRKSYSSASAMDDDSLGNYDDDEFISNMRKKFVSSDEILERIKKMDNDI